MQLQLHLSLSQAAFQSLRSLSMVVSLSPDLCLWVLVGNGGMDPYDSPLRSPIVVPITIPPFPTKNQRVLSISIEPARLLY